MKKFFKIILWAIGIIIAAVAGLLIYAKTALPDVGAAPDLKVEYTPERIKRGEYLANHVSVCMDCHSERDYSLWSAPPKEGTFGQGGERFDQAFGFPGVFISKNITPSGIGGWTDGELYRAITKGVNKDGKALFPIMPWEYYGRMDPEDIHSIIAYIRTLKPIEKPQPASVPDFPMNFILNTLPRVQEPMKKPGTKDLAAYGAYVVNSAGCPECHTKKEQGKVIGEPFAGGFEFNLPDGARLISPNITPDNETGIGTWTEQAFLAKFKQYADSGYQHRKLAPGEMMTLMPWTMYSGMDSTDLRAIYAYLRGVKPVKNTIVRWNPAKG